MKENTELDLNGLDEDAEDVPNSESEDGAGEQAVRSPSPIESKGKPEPENETIDTEAGDEEEKPKAQKGKKGKNRKPTKGSLPEVVRLSKAELRAQQRDLALRAALAEEETATNPNESGSRKSKEKGKKRQQQEVELTPMEDTSPSVPPEAPLGTDKTDAASAIDEIDEEDIDEGGSVQTSDPITGAVLSKKEKRRAKEAAKNVQQAGSPVNLVRLSSSS